MNGHPAFGMPLSSARFLDTDAALHSSQPDAHMCQRCKRGRMHRVHRDRYLDFLLSQTGFDRTVCNHCNRRGLRLKRSRLAAFLALASLFFGGMVVLAANTSTMHPPFTEALPRRQLTNQDVVDLAHSRMSGEFILDLIARIGTSFQIDSQAIIALRNAGVSEEVIIGMVDSTIAAEKPAGANRQQGAQPPTCR